MSPKAIPSLLHTPTAAEDGTGACAYRGAVEALCRAAAQCVGDTEAVSSALDALGEVLRGDKCMQRGPADECAGEDGCGVRGMEPVARLVIHLLQSRHLPAQPLVLCLRLLSEVASSDPAACELLVSLGAIEAVHAVMQSTAHAAVVQSDGVSALSALARGKPVVGVRGCVCGNEDSCEGLSDVHGLDAASHKRPVPVGSTTQGGHAKRPSHGRSGLLRQETLIDEANDHGKGDDNSTDDMWFMADVEDEDGVDQERGSGTLRESQIAVTVDDAATVHGGHRAAMLRDATQVATTTLGSPSGVSLVPSLVGGVGGMALMGGVGEMVEEQRRPRSRALPRAEGGGVSINTDLLPLPHTRSRGAVTPPGGLHPIDTTADDNSAMDDSLDGASVSVMISSPTVSSPSSWSSTSSTSPRPHSPSLSRAHGPRSHQPTRSTSSRASGNINLTPLTINTSTPYATTTRSLRSRSAVSVSPTTCPFTHAHEVWLQSGGGGGGIRSCNAQAVGTEAPALTPKGLCHSRSPSMVSLNGADGSVPRALRVLCDDACGGDGSGAKGDDCHAGGSGVRRHVSGGGHASTPRPSVGGGGLVRPSSMNTLGGVERPVVAVPRLKLSGMCVDENWDESQPAIGERGARPSHSTTIAVGDAGRGCGGDSDGPRSRGSRSGTADGLQHHMGHSKSTSVLPMLSPPATPCCTTTTIKNALLVMPKLALGDMIPADDAHCDTSASLSGHVRQHHTHGRSSTCTPSVPRLNLGEMPTAVSPVESDANMSSGGQLRRGPLPVSLHGGKLEPLRPREQLRPLRSPVPAHGTSPPGGGMFFAQSPLPRPLSWDNGSEK